MVDRTDLTQINQLYEESRLLEAALGNFEAGGVISQMTVSGGPLGAPPPSSPMFQPPRMAVTIPTTGIIYPQAMVEAIKAALTGRLGEIDRELEGLGVTGFEARAAQAIDVSAAAARPPQPRAQP